MAGYRFYCLDTNGRIGLAEWIDAATDDEAIRIARELRPSVTRCEVWEGARLVAKINPDGHLEKTVP